MKGPFTLLDESISKNIEPKKIGVYILSCGNDVANYVGRSDTDLNVRLKQHIQTGNYAQFWFELVNSALEAYYLECKWYHKYSRIDCCPGRVQELHRS